MSRLPGEAGPLFDHPVDVPVLRDGEITLRAHEPADTPRIVQMCQDPQSLRWTAIPESFGPGEAAAFLRAVRIGWAEKDHRGWAIDVAGVGFAGNVDVRGRPVATLGFVLHPAVRGRGVMRRAVDLAVDWAFTEGGVDAVHYQAAVGNIASLRVAHACGFTLLHPVPALLDHRGVVTDAWTAVRRIGDHPGPRSRWLDAPRLAGPRAVLRSLRDDDAERIAEACADPLIRRYIAGLPVPYTLASARAYIDDARWQAAKGVQVTWAVTAPGTELLCGVIGASGIGAASSAEIGFWTHPDHRGRGLMSEAARLVAEYALDAGGLDLERLELWAAAENEPSRRVARHAGFTETARAQRGERLGDGRLVDLIGSERLR